MKTLCLRTLKEEDFPFILSVNEANVSVLSPMDEEKLRRFQEIATLFLVAEVEGEPAAFLIALREGCHSYDSENYLWFQRQYEQFLYIDRIVIAEPYRHLGLGRRLYQAVWQEAQLTNIPFITAEIDTIPYNGTSLSFHKAMGFREVGVQSVRGNTIQVSLQEWAVSPSL